VGIPPLLIVLTGKTAAGKDAVMSKLLEKMPNLKRVVSTTSRAIRTDETNGVDYNFISKEDFRRKIENKEFIEYVEYGGNLYGTEKSQIKKGQDLIWRIDPSRAGKVKQLITGFKILVIYLTVRDCVILKRLQDRNLNKQEIEKRMQDDKKFWQEYKDNYDYVVENIPGKLDEAVDKITNLIKMST